MLVDFIRDAYTGGEIKWIIKRFGFKCPARITDMYLSGESPEYMAAAVLAVNQSGE